MYPVKRHRVLRSVNRHTEIIDVSEDTTRQNNGKPKADETEESDTPGGSVHTSCERTLTPMVRS